MEFLKCLIALLLITQTFAKHGRIQKRETDDQDEQHDDGDEDELGEIICTKTNPVCECQQTKPESVICNEISFPVDDGYDEQLNTANLQTADDSTKYKIVRITRNQIHELKKGKIVPKMVNSVEELDFTYNQIQRIEAKAFDDFPKLKVLKLGYNRVKLDYLKNALTKDLGAHLNNLQLNNNKLKEIPDGLFHNLTNLKTLVLDGNQNLQITKDMFDKNLENLETLSLDNCNIRDLPDDVFDNLPKLNKLSLIGNPLSKIPAAINSITHLKILDLSSTNIPELDFKSLDKDHLLNTLIMRNLGYLYAIEDCAFCGLDNLKVTDFTNCTHLYSIHSNAFGSTSATNEIPKLTKVSFGNCNLTTLDKDLVNWSDLTELNIGGNPLMCDCKLSWLLRDHYLKMFDNNDSPTCAEPESARGQKLSEVQNTDCPKEKAKINTRLFFGSFLFFVLVVGAIFGLVKYTRRRGRLTNVFNRSELPEIVYDQMPNNDIMNDGYTYSLQQDHANNESV